MNRKPRTTNHESRITPRLRSGQANPGFTLIELITVIIIIGLLLAVALPKYMQMAEKTKAVNAKQVLDILRKAEEAYYVENTAYVAYDSTSTTGIVDDIPNTKIKADHDWTYTVTAPTTTTFNAIATRKTGQAYAGATITIDQDGSYAYSTTAPIVWKGVGNATTTIAGVCDDGSACTIGGTCSDGSTCS